MAMRQALLVASCLLLTPLVAGHGAMVTPRSRNSIDFEEGPVGKATWAA